MRRRKRVDDRSACGLCSSSGGRERVVSSRARGERIEPVVRGRGRATEKPHHRAAGPAAPSTAAATGPNRAERQVGPKVGVRAATNRALHGGIDTGSPRKAQIAEARALIDQADSVIPTMFVLSTWASASRRNQRWLECRGRLLQAWLVGAEHAAHRREQYLQHEHLARRPPHLQREPLLNLDRPEKKKEVRVEPLVEAEF